MVRCSFKEEKELPDGTWQRSECHLPVEILFINDPCYGLCYACAYRKTLASNKRLREGFELYVILRDRGRHTPRAILDRITAITGVEYEKGHIVSATRKDLEQALKDG